MSNPSMGYHRVKTPGRWSRPSTTLSQCRLVKVSSGPAQRVSRLRQVEIREGELMNQECPDR
jgi:hypothetical protein